MLLMQRISRQGCAGRRIIHPCRNGASTPADPFPACTSTVPFPGLHTGLVCVFPGLHPGLVCAVPGLHPGLVCAVPGLHPGLICAVPGLHPGLICVAPLGQMGPGAFSRRRRSWRGERGQRWTRHVTSRKCDGRLSASVARCCGGGCGFLGEGGCRGCSRAALRRELR